MQLPENLRLFKKLKKKKKKVTVSPNWTLPKEVSLIPKGLMAALQWGCVGTPAHSLQIQGLPLHTLFPHLFYLLPCLLMICPDGRNRSLSGFPASSQARAKQCCHETSLHSEPGHSQGWTLSEVLGSKHIPLLLCPTLTPRKWITLLARKAAHGDTV